jgi:hypothetical protein
LRDWLAIGDFELTIRNRDAKKHNGRSEGADELIKNNRQRAPASGVRA